RMRTLFAQILLWLWCTLAIFVIGSAFISALSVNQNASSQQAPGARLVKFQLEEARVAYETGGRPALTEFMDNLTRIYEAKGIGGGDFSARVNSKRRDEMGKLARTFDRMADRIELLLTAERRLLGDISHELRSPLARLGVAIELARSGDDLNRALNRIQKESD